MGSRLQGNTAGALLAREVSSQDRILGYPAFIPDSLRSLATNTDSDDVG